MLSPGSVCAWSPMVGSRPALFAGSPGPGCYLLTYIKGTFPRLVELCGNFTVMNTLLWSLQILVAITFLYSGINKSIYTAQTLINKGQTGVAGLQPGLIKFIGITEILGALGLVFPWWMQIAPILTPVSAICFAVVMILAMIAHYRLMAQTGNKKEARNMVNNLILLILALVIAWGRL